MSESASLFEASRVLAKVRAEILEAGPQPPHVLRDDLLRQYRTAMLGLQKAAVRYTEARMRADANDVFGKLFPAGWFEVVDGFPHVREVPR